MRLGVTNNVANVSCIVSLDPAELADAFQRLPAGAPPGVVDVVVPTVYCPVFLGQVIFGVVGGTSLAEAERNQKQDSEHFLLGKLMGERFYSGLARI